MPNPENFPAFGEIHELKKKLQFPIIKKSMFSTKTKQKIYEKSMFSKNLCFFPKNLCFPQTPPHPPGGYVEIRGILGLNFSDRFLPYAFDHLVPVTTAIHLPSVLLASTLTTVTVFSKIGLFQREVYQN